MTMRIRRGVTAFGALGLIAAMVSGCTTEAPAPSASVDLETVDPSGAQIVFWYQHTREREDALLDMIADFNRSNRYGITVHGEYAGKYDDIYNKMTVGLQSGTVPDLLVAYQNQAREYFRADGIVDLQPYMDSPKWGLTDADRRDFFPAFLQQDRIGNAQACFPPNRSMEVLYYNVDWLAELGYDHPPATWDEFAEMCRAAHRRPFSKAATHAPSLGFMVEIDASRLASMVFGRGGDLMTPARDAYSLDTPQMRAALSLVLDLIQQGCVQVVGEEFGDQKEFSVGRVLFAQRSSSGIPFFRSAVEDGGAGFRWDVTHPPCSGAAPVVNVYGASLAVGHTTPERELAAWLFIRWFTEPDQQARWVRASNYFPVRRSVAEKLVDYFAENPQYRSAYDLLEYGRSEPSVAGYQQVRRMIEDTMVAIFDGEDMDEALASLQRRANQTLEPSD